MTVTNIALETLSARERFKMAGTAPLSTGIDEAMQRLQAIFAISSLIAGGYADSRAGKNETGLKGINPGLVEAAWEGVALLAADAAFALHEAV